MPRLVFIINGITKESSLKDLKQSFDDLQRPTDVDIDLVLWSTDDIGSNNDICTVHAAQYEPLADISSLLSHLPDTVDPTDTECAVVMVDSTTYSMKPNLVEVLVTKLSEHDVFEDSNILTATGFRVFPHEKVTNGSLTTGIHYKQYNETRTDRQLHVFTTEFCLVPLQVLVRLTNLQDNKPAHGNNSLWLSYVTSTRLDPPVSIWKIKMAACLCKLKPNEYSIDSVVPNNGFQSLYLELYDASWPKGVTEYTKLPIKAKPSNMADAIWSNGFGGVNMQIHPASEQDFTVAAAYGIKVIRIGAVADAKDLIYLLDSKSDSAVQDEAHLLKVLPRLKAALARAGALGMKVIITMVDLPGCYFHSGGPIEGFWNSSECRERIVKFWYTLACNLLDVRDIVICYDVINEPYTVEDTECDYYDDMPLVHGDTLMEFYSRVIHKIREVDSTVGILLKGQWFASPRAFEVLRPVDDDNVYYGFHAYISPLLTLRRILDVDTTEVPSYPGNVRKWINYDEEIPITFETLRASLIETIRAWQLKYQVPSRKIIVAEFGITRETQGAEQYLSDLVKIFNEFQWSWLVFSFRDEEWDALDYELGPHMSNQLYRSPTPLFQAVAKHFH